MDGKWGKGEGREEGGNKDRGERVTVFVGVCFFSEFSSFILYIFNLNSSRETAKQRNSHTD